MAVRSKKFNEFVKVIEERKGVVTLEAGDGRKIYWVNRGMETGRVYRITGDLVSRKKNGERYAFLLNAERSEAVSL